MGGSEGTEGMGLALNTMQRSLYIHIPFCAHRCAYCDFNTYAGQEAAIPAYVEALRREIEWVAAFAPEQISVHTIFFGGGTPTLLSPDQFRVILDAVRCNFEVEDGVEITTEANPGTVSERSLGEMRVMGINRISFGAQSANGEELRMLERTHTFLDVMEAVRAARRAGFYNLNLDLIYGLPEQRLETWQSTVRRVLELQPEHVSAYALTLEHGTPFGRWAAKGLLPVPDPDAAAEMYEWGSDELEGAGYQQYEISNWGRKRSAVSSQLSARNGVAELSAIRSDKEAESGKWGEEAGKDGESVKRADFDGPEPPGYACRHNLQYWRCLPYLGFGAGAHGYANGHRYSNVLRIATYIDRLMGGGGSERKSGMGNREAGGTKHGEAADRQFPLSPAAVNQHKQTLRDDMAEFMITGLRLTREGVSPATFRERFGADVMEIYGKEIEELQRLELLESTRRDTSDASDAPEALRLTKRGRLLGNQVFMRFV